MRERQNILLLLFSKFSNIVIRFLVSFVLKTTNDFLIYEHDLDSGHMK